MSGSKPSIFKRPAWAATKSTEDSPGDKSVFGRHRVYEDIVAAQRKKQEEREAKQKAKAEKAAAKGDTSEGPVKKRRRLSKDTSPEPTDSDSNTRSSPSVQATTPEPAQPTRQLRSTPQKQAKLLNGLEDEVKPKKPAHNAAAINLDESDDDGDASTHVEKRSNSSLKKNIASPKVVQKTDADIEPEDEEDDPFLRELQRKARENARQLQKEKDAEARRTKSPSVAAFGQSPATEGSPATASQEQDEQPKALVPNVAILIKTHIPGTKDLIINRHSSQVLQPVKEYWTKLHKLEPAFAKQVFFTWRGMKLYDSSTMQSLINNLKRERHIPLDSDEDPSNGKIQIEAVTQEILDQQTRAKAELAKSSATSGTAAGDDEDYTPREPPKKEGIILILKCKDVPEMPLRVRPNTSIGKIMRAFQSQRNIDKSKKCWLVFDGERLEEDMTVQEAEFEDGAQVEVHPR